MNTHTDLAAETGCEAARAATPYWRVKGSNVRVPNAAPAEVRDPITGFTREEAEPPF